MGGEGTCGVWQKPMGDLWSLAFFFQAPRNGVCLASFRRVRAYQLGPWGLFFWQRGHSRSSTTYATSCACRFLSQEQTWTTARCGPQLDRVNSWHWFISSPCFLWTWAQKELCRELSLARRREKRGRWTCYFPCRSWWGREGVGGSTVKGFHLSFHPSDNLLPRMWCFTWPRGTQWWRASFEQHHIPQIEKRVVEMHCAWFEAHTRFLTLCSCCLQQEYHHHHHHHHHRLCFIIVWIAADWNVSLQKSELIESINRFSCFFFSAWESAIEKK